MPDDDIICPLCGNRSKIGTEKCQVCGTEFHKVRQRKVRDKPAGVKPSGDLLRKEIPKPNIRETKLNCPFCAMELKGGETKCPRCSVPLSSAPAKPTPKAEEEMLECPECGKFTSVGSKKCPNCGVKFEEAVAGSAPAPAEEIPPPPEEVEATQEFEEETEAFVPAPPPDASAHEPVPEPEPEPIREVVTAVAPPPSKAGEGYINGKGAASDRGFINGTGLVNGTGLTNGTRAEIKLSQAEARERSFLMRWQFLAVLVALVIIIPTFVYLSYYSGPEGLVIDGEFDDWRSVDRFGAYVSSGTSSIDIEEWAVKVVDSAVYVYVKVEGYLMSTSNVESFFLFVDSDDNAHTGYIVAGMGADYLLQIDGWDGEIRSTALNEYGVSSDYDWSSWSYMQSLEAGRGASEFEAKAVLPTSVDQDARYMLVSQDQVARSSASYPVQTAGGVLVVKQELGPAVSQPLSVVMSGSSVALLTLSFTSEGTGGEVTSVSPYVVGASLAWSFQEFTLSPGETRRIDVTIDTTSSAAGDLVAAYVTKSNIVSSFADVIVIGDGVRAYVTSAPTEIRIDGAFGDWAGIVTVDSDPVAPSNSNIDITGLAAVNTAESSSFFVSVTGEMCAGSFVPVIIGKPVSGGGGGVVVPTRKTGEDTLRIYIDSDVSAATGYLYSMPGKTIGANFMVEVKGLYGRIVSKALLQYSAGAWSPVLGAIPEAAKDMQRLELSVRASYIGGSSSIDYIVEMTDWLQHNDQATSFPVGARSLETAPVSAFNPEGWYIEDPTNSALATAMSYQRKLFYDGTNFWSFYWNGANTVYRYSADNGVTWSGTTIPFKTSGVDKVSIWYDSTNSIVYAVGDTSTATRDVVLQRGVVNPATKTISWAGSDSTAQISLNAMASKNSFICKDSQGYLWVLASNLSNPEAPVMCDLSVFRSASADSIGSWVFSGNMLSVASNLLNPKGIVLPAGSGSSVWAVYAYDGNVAARKYTGVWSTPTVIYTPGTTETTECTDNAPPSAVVDSNGVIHVVYGNGHKQPSLSKPYIYYVYNTGSSWSVPYRLDSVSNTLGNMYPTISLDRSTGQVYALWVETDNTATPRTIVCRKNMSGTWQTLTLPAQTTGPKHHLTSIYSAPADYAICWQWTQNTTAPIQVIFEKIPEFGTVLVPAFALMMFVVAFAGRSRRRWHP